MINAEQVIENMIEVKLISGEDGFVKVCETLTRMGVASKQENILSQTAHILHRRGKYYICHFKELLSLDGLRTDITDSDIARRNRIAQMLSDWNLVEIVNPHNLDPMGKPNVVMVIKHSEKRNWELRAKYTIGTKKNRNQGKNNHE